MNYEPGQKVKVSVNGAEWEDETTGRASRDEPDSEWTYYLKSGVIVSESMLSPIEPEIKPEPGDIVSVWDTTYEDEPKHPWFFREFVKMEDCKYGVLGEHVNGNTYYWSGCRVVARKPKRWEEISEDKQNIIRRSMFIFGHEHIGMPREEAYDKILSIILDGVPYARIDK